MLFLALRDSDIDIHSYLGVRTPKYLLVLYSCTNNALMYRDSWSSRFMTFRPHYADD